MRDKIKNIYVFYNSRFRRLFHVLQNLVLMIRVLQNLVLMIHVLQNLVLTISVLQNLVLTIHVFCRNFQFVNQEKLKNLQNYQTYSLLINQNLTLIN